MKSSRRDFFKQIGVGAAAVAVATLIDRSPLLPEAFAANCKVADPNVEGTPKVLKYVHDAKDAKGQKTKADICSACQLYMKPKEKKMKIGGKEQAGAPCMAFGNQCVAAAGWCSSFVKRA